MKKTLLLITMIAIGLGMYSISDAGDLTLDIAPGKIFINALGNLTIGSVVTDSQTGQITGTFSNNTFIMGDKRGGPGYYTTIQADDLIKGSDRIANTNIQLKTLDNPTIISGINNAFMRFGSGIKNQFGTIDMPMTFFIRNPNEGTGQIGKFGDTSDINITVPANQAAGAYRATMYYTLYDM